MITSIIVASIVLLFGTLGYIRHKQAKNKVVQVIIDNCTGCQLCIKKCHHKAISIVKDDSGKKHAVITPDKCTTCSDCISACKFNALEIISRR